MTAATLTLPVWSAPLILAGILGLVAFFVVLISLWRPEVRDQVERLADPDRPDPSDCRSYGASDRRPS